MSQPTRKNGDKLLYMKIKIKADKTQYPVDTEDPYIAHLIQYHIKRKRLKFKSRKEIHRFLIGMDEALGITSKISLAYKDIHDFDYWNYQPKQSEY